MQKKWFYTIGLMATGLIVQAQTSAESNIYDPQLHKIIPDKVFEIGLPVILLLALGHALITLLKNRAEHQLKLKMMEKDISEQTMISIFKESNAIQKLQPMKWFLFSAAFAIAFIIIHIIREYLIAQSGYLAVGIILICVSIAFFTYYRILSDKL